MKKVFWRKLVVLVVYAAIIHHVLVITHAEKKTRNILCDFGACQLIATTLHMDGEGVAAPAADLGRSTAVDYEEEEVRLTETAEEGNFIVINRAELAGLAGEKFSELMESCHAFLEGNKNRILDAGGEYQRERGKQFAVGGYPSEEATVKARWLRDWLSRRIAPGSTIVLMGDEGMIPTWEVQLGRMRVTTDSFYSDLDGDGVPDTAVARMLGEPDSMIRQLAGKRDYGSKAVILCSEDTRIHLETRAFAKSLSNRGFRVAIRGGRDDEALSASDVIVHFGHGNPSGISNRFGEAFVSAGEMPLLRRSPIVFVDGCGTLPVGSPLLRAFLKQGALVYVGSTATVQGMIPARFTNELVEHFLGILAKEPPWPLPRVLTASRAAYVRGHPGLAERLRELAASGRIRASGNEASHFLTVTEWVYYGDPRATIPNVGPPQEICREVASVKEAVCLDRENESWHTAFATKRDDGRTVASFHVAVPVRDRSHFQLTVHQDGREISALDSSQDTVYQNIGRDCRGGHISRDTYRARYLIPLLDGEGEQNLEVRLVKGTSVVLTPGTKIDVWPADFEEHIGLRLEPTPIQPQKVAGTAELRATGVEGFVALDLSSLFNRPHDSLRIGGGDNASFKTWFSEDGVSADGVPFLVKRTGKNVLVSENNTQNVFEIKGIGVAARSVHFLVWGYNFPREPAKLHITFDDGSFQKCEIPLSEWTRGVLPVAFDFKNTVTRFEHAAIVHQVVRIARPNDNIVSIASVSGMYGLVAITLEQDEPKPTTIERD